MLERDCTQQRMNLMTNFVSKDLQAMWEKTLKKEIIAIRLAKENEMKRKKITYGRN